MTLWLILSAVVAGGVGLIVLLEQLVQRHREPSRTAAWKALGAVPGQTGKLLILYGKSGGKSRYERERMRQRSRPVLRFGKRA